VPSAQLLPKADPDGPLLPKVCRSALLGVSASCVSDTVANALRVIKTTKQTHADPISYLQAARLVVAKDGWAGLVLRGLSTRLITNAIQASVCVCPPPPLSLHHAYACAARRAPHAPT
jgi:hypothetical protein